MTPPTTPLPRKLQQMLEPYKGKWVTLSYDEKRLLGYGDTMQEALDMAKKTDPNELPLLIKVPDEGSSFVLL